MNSRRAIMTGMCLSVRGLPSERHDTTPQAFGLHRTERARRGAFGLAAALVKTSGNQRARSGSGTPHRSKNLFDHLVGERE